jgi:peptidyl-prolyl cis-trans isomerase SurA
MIRLFRLRHALRSVLVAALLAASLPALGQPLERIAAVVDEDIILQSELDRAVANIRIQYAGKEAQLPPSDVLQRQVLERLILIRLQAARAASTGLRVSDEEVDNAVLNIARQNKLSVDQLRQQLAADGLGYGEFRSSLRDEIVVQRLRQRFAQRLNVSEAEVDAAMKAQAGGNTQYRLAHILVALPEGATAEQIATGQRKIEGVKSLLERGEMEFSAAAVRYSDSPNALEGGDLGWRALDQIPTSFSGTIRSMQVGQVIGPIRGPSGFQLIKLEDTRNADAGDAQMVTQYQARHILIRTEEDGTSDTAAKAKLDTLRARITGGADFAELATKHSEDTISKARGGDLGWFAQDDFGPEFGAQVAGLSDGGVSEAFKTQAGWHLVQRIGTRQNNVTDDNRRSRVRESIGQRKLEDDWNRYLREMRGEAFIDIRTGSTSAGEPPATGG